MLRKLTLAVAGARDAVAASLRATAEAFDVIGDVDLGPLDEPDPARASNPARRATAQAAA